MATSVSYPHPVLGNGDDIAVGKIEPEVTFRAADEIVELDVRNLVTSNPTLDPMLADGRASWGIRVQCARTYMRSEFRTANRDHQIKFDGHDLDGRVEVDVVLFAAKVIAGYQPAGAHPDYGTASFDLEPGEVLGVGPAFSFDVDKQFDPLRAPVASIMRVSKGEHPDGPFRMALEDEFVEIILSQEDWAHYAGVKDRVPGVLHVSLVLPALAEALRRMGEFAGRRWADRLRAIVEARQVNVGQPLEAAQLLLQQPLTRAFDELNAELDRETT
jgi:hypothetical protein